MVFNWLNNLRATATIAIIFVHVSNYVVQNFDSNDVSMSWWTGNIYNSLFRIGSPIFVMITGTLFLSKDIQIKPFIHRRFIRVCIPFLFWSAIYIFIYILKNKNFTMPEISETIFSKLTNGAQYQMWYIYLILGLYLFIPILSKWIRNCTEKEIIYFLVIWLVASFFDIGGLLRSYFPKIELSYFTGYIGYLVLGYYLSTKSFGKEKNIKMISLLLYFIGIMITIFGTYFISIKENGYDEFFKRHFMLNSLLSIIGVFLFVKSINITNPVLLKGISIVNKYSYGIFLSHPLALTILRTTNIHTSFNPIWGIPTMVLLALIISIIITVTINKLPLGKYVSG